MRILITGGTGYLGGRLAQYLVSNTSNTIILGTRNKVTELAWLPQVQVVNTLWNSESELEKICFEIDVVIHLVGMNAIDCSNNPLLALEVNGLFTARLLQSSIKQNVKRFIYISSAHIYDDSLRGKITEQSPSNNLHPYATSHRTGEDVVRSAHLKSEIEGVVIRLSNSFGAPAHVDTNCWSLVTNDLCRQALKSSHMILKITKMQRRDFISITDVCRAIEHLMNLNTSLLNDGLFNLGGEWSPTITEVAKTLSERVNFLTGKEITIKSSNLEKNSSPPNLDYDIAKIKLTGFELRNHRESEFDNLILFCKKWFGV